MRGVRVNSMGAAAKGLAELNHHVQKELKEVRNGVTGEGQGLLEEDESRINGDADTNHQHKMLAQPLAVQQRPLQQTQGPQGHVVCWDRFLPFGTLKVLLVENDDSTRHLVSALLQNCSYEVTAVADGIEAWKILEDQSNHIDLVLTEVTMPYLSGIGLLNKIMNHKTCKNTPVIMMSSNDSMGIVFKCLSKGAVDFLVKPLRKNELKNLWQHVWRKCHSSSGSGSESGIWTQKSSKSETVEESGNNSVRNDEDDIASIGLSCKDGGDNGSGTQSSWTKQAVEVNSTQPLSPCDKLADAPNGTCPPVIHLSPEAFDNNWVSTAGTMEHHGINELGLRNAVPKISNLLREDEIKELVPALARGNEGGNLESEIEEDGVKFEKEKTRLNSGTPNEKSSEEVADLIGVIDCVNGQMDSAANEMPNDGLKMNVKDESMNDLKETPSLELTLKRRRDVGEVETAPREHNVLRRSNLSAFSRYKAVSTANQTPTGNVGSCSPHDNSSEVEKTENLPSNSNGSPNQGSNGSSNNNDMGSTTNNSLAKPACNDKPTPKSAVNVHPCSAFQPVRNSLLASPHTATPSKGEVAAANTALAQANGIQPQVQVQHHHHHYHHHHHHVHSMQQQKKLPQKDDLSFRTIVGPSIDLTTPVEGNAANYSLNRSDSGSNNGGDGPNGSGNVGVTEGANVCSESGLAGNVGAGGGGEWGSGSGSRSGVDQNRNAQREAALNKFRQKRKERCFEKKVRYYSRKKLAEQRPRVRGQFVRQGGCNNKSKDDNC